MKTKRIQIKSKFEPRDLWVGIFWDKQKLFLTVYVCIVPMFPIILTFYLGEVNEIQKETNSY